MYAVTRKGLLPLPPGPTSARPANCVWHRAQCECGSARWELVATRGLGKYDPLVAVNGVVAPPLLVRQFDGGACKTHQGKGGGSGGLARLRDHGESVALARLCGTDVLVTLIPY